MAEEIKFTIDNMLYEMCVNPLGLFSHDGKDSRDNFDAKTAFFTEYRPDGTMDRYNIESVKLPMNTPLDLIDKWTAISLISEYFGGSYDVADNAQLAYDRFATREVDGQKYVYGWYDRSK